MYEVDSKQKLTFFRLSKSKKHQQNRHQKIYHSYIPDRLQIKCNPSYI